MSTLLMLEVMDDAPDSLTWRERYVLMALADNFNDKTRRGWPAFEGDDERSKKFRRRVRCTRRQFYETLGSLIDKGVLEQEVRGQKHRQAVFRIPELSNVVRVRESRTLSEGPGRVSDTPTEGFPEGSGKAHGGLTESAQGAENPHAEDGSGCGNDGLRVRENRTPIPQDSLTLDLLKDANAARVGWGVWGEGSVFEATATGSQPVTASADAPAGDGLRPRGFAAPARNIDQSEIDDAEQPPPVVEVLKNAATGTASERPGVGDLVPKQIKRAQRQYEPPPREKPPRWAPEQQAQQKAEFDRILEALKGIDDVELNRLESAMLRTDLKAVGQGRVQASQWMGPLSGESDTDPARMRRHRLYGLIYGLRLRPLATWPQEMLPPALRGPETATEAA